MKFISKFGIAAVSLLVVLGSIEKASAFDIDLDRLQDLQKDFKDYKDDGGSGGIWRWMRDNHRSDWEELKPYYQEYQDDGGSDNFRKWLKSETQNLIETQNQTNNGGTTTASSGTNSQVPSFGEDSIDMILNGEFNVGRTLQYGSYERASSAISYWERNQTELPPGFSSWDETRQHYWFKRQGYSGADARGTDGELTGNFLHNHGGSDTRGATIQQTFTLGTDIDTKALFSFDSLSWGSVGNKLLGISVTGTQSGNLLSLDNLFSDPQKNSEDWINNEFVFDVLGGEDITVEFKTSGKVSIDGVKFLVNEMVDEPTKDVPEPASILGLLAVSGIGTVSIKRRKKAQENLTDGIE